jgi:hypothetical protein
MKKLAKTAQFCPIVKSKLKKIPFIIKLLATVGQNLAKFG